jgi:hypothetical protein
LIEPIIGTLASSRPIASEEVDFPEDGLAVVKKREPEASEHHPFIQGLLDTLPEPQTNWAIEGRAKWLQAAANIFDLIYKGTGEIDIRARSEESPQ